MANAEIIEPDFQKIIDKIPGSEGPVFNKDGVFFMVAPTCKDDEDRDAGKVLKINLEEGSKEVLCAPSVDGYGGIPAGCQCDKDNALWVADMRLGILKIDNDGKFRQMFTRDSEGRVLQGCNDCIFDYDGNLWVTAPAGEIAPHPFRISKQEPFGSVYCVPKYANEVIRIDTGLRFPNGIAVLHTDDGRPKTLILAETPTSLLWSYEIQGPGKVGPRSVWGKLPCEKVGGGDGMDFDEDNNLLVTNTTCGYIEVFSPSGGEPIQRIKCSFTNKPSNLHFQPGGNTLYVTEHQHFGLWKLEWKRKGKAQYCDL